MQDVTKGQESSAAIHNLRDSSYHLYSGCGCSCATQPHMAALVSGVVRLRLA
jgi:hypothetical protein